MILIVHNLFHWTLFHRIWRCGECISIYMLLFPHCISPHHCPQDQFPVVFCCSVFSFPSSPIHPFIHFLLGPVTFPTFHSCEPSGLWSPPPLGTHYREEAFLPGKMTSGNPSLRVSAKALLNTAWFSRLMCSSSPRSSCREMMRPGGSGNQGGGNMRKKGENNNKNKQTIEWRSVGLWGQSGNEEK